MQWLIKFKDSFLSVIPLVFIALILYFTGLVKLETNQLILFSICSAFVIVGMTIFGQGVDNSISVIGEYVGSSITKRKSIILIIFLFLLLGTFITLAEPDISVLASQIPIDSWVFILCVGIGSGILMVVGVLRILFEKSLKIWLLAFYGLVFAIACIVDKSFLPLSFDAGGVSAGPMTVPFIMAIGIGIASSRAGRSNSDCFGLTALCSLGPILTVMILSLFLDKNQLSYSLTNYDSNPDIVMSFVNAFGPAARDVAVSLVPILVFFIVYELIFIKLPRKTMLKIIVGLIYTYIGLVLFMMAVNAGFISTAYFIGTGLGGNQYAGYLLPLIGLAFGLFTVLAEPAVPVLVGQIRNVSDGVIKKSSIYLALSIGVGLAVCLSMLRIYYRFDLMYYLVPGYIIALALTFFSPNIYTAIAFDSGGVASGAMNAAFVLPFAIGACYAVNGNADRIMSDALGIVAMVTLAPIITIQLVGIFAVQKQNIILRKARESVFESDDNQIIHFE